MRLLILIGMIYLGYKVCKSYLKSVYLSNQSKIKKTFNNNASGSIVDDIMVQDPLCGVYFPKRKGIRLTYDGKKMLFCSHECREKYLALHSMKNNK